MNEIAEYLLAQARYRPVATLRFAAGELWRRGRLRISNGRALRLPEFTSYRLPSRLRPFLPEECADGDRFFADHSLAAEQALEGAARVMKHEVEIFGERVELGKEIDWHRDWVSGHRWAREAGAGLRLLAGGGADVKRPWELCRFHHLLVLGKAYRVTRAPEYAGEFMAQVQDWLCQNPYPAGIHWAMPMEAAIRAVNWIAAATLFGDSPELGESFWQVFLGSLFLHGRHVYAYREWNAIARGNHYLACVAGLAWLGVLFHDTEEGKRWLALARRELIREMSTQVTEDGVAHEGSSGYHAFDTELFLSAALAVARHDAGRGGNEPDSRRAIEASFGSEFVAKLEKMFGFLAALEQGREAPPIWGDRDDGRLLPFCGRAGTASAHLLALGRTLFERPDWPAGCAGCEEVWWRLGREPARVETVARVDAECAAYPQAGFFFLNSARLRVSARCGPLGINGWANHAHCDQLSFECACDGKAVIVDPGTYSYSGEAAARNLFRSTAYHNVVCVEGQEQNRFWPGLLFRMVDDARSRLLEWSITPGEARFAGEHCGYLRLPQRVRVRRDMRLERQRHELVISDEVRGRGSARLEWNLHVAPTVVPVPLADDVGSEVRPAEVERDAVLRAAWRLGPMVLRVWLPATVRHAEFDCDSGWVAPRYGQREAAPVLRWRFSAALPVRIVFLLAVE